MKRKLNFERVTRETDIKGSITINGKGVSEIDTGIGFLNHMLDLFAFHSGWDITVTCRGDLEVCAHHSVEDIALTLGKALDDLLGDRKGISRYAFSFLPMDEALTRTVVDVSGRPCHVFEGEFESDHIGELPTEMIRHFFYSFSMSARLTLHQAILYGDNDHHKAESLFKGFARCMADALSSTTSGVPSSKGVL